MSEVCKLVGIHKTRTIPFHPQGDGLVERFDNTMLNICLQSVLRITHMTGKSISGKSVGHIIQVFKLPLSLLHFT